MAPSGKQAFGATFAVDSTADAGDASPGDGTCATAGGPAPCGRRSRRRTPWPGPTDHLPAASTRSASPATDEDAAATGDLDITDDLTIRGAGRDDTVIDGGDIDRVFHTVGSISVDISGVTIQNGSTASFFPDDGDSGVGGGIFNSSGVTLTLTDATVRGNWASHGGGGIHNSGAMTLVTSAVNDNLGGVSGEGGGGGGISNGARRRSSTASSAATHHRCPAAASPVVTVATA